jgi:hypothetical protein
MYFVFLENSKVSHFINGFFKLYFCLLLKEINIVIFGFILRFTSSHQTHPSASVLKDPSYARVSKYVRALSITRDHKNVGPYCYLLHSQPSSDKSAYKHPDDPSTSIKTDHATYLHLNAFSILQTRRCNAVVFSIVDYPAW